MKVTDIHTLLNETMEEVTGQSNLVAEDLSNIVDVGKTIFTTTDINTDYKDPYVRALLNRIGRMVFVDRKYNGYAPKVLKDAWEYGSIMSKSRAKVFDAETNPAWSLTSGQTVNQFEYNAPSVETKFYNEKDCWQIACSFTDMQLKQSFTSATEMNRFISMIENRIDMSMTMYLDNMIMRTINNFIAEKIQAGNGVIDLLSAYNNATGSSLTATQALTNKEFLRHSAMTIMLYKSRLNAPSTIFNISTNNDNVTFTPDDRMHIVLIENFAKAIDVYLQSDTYHNELTSIGGYETVPYWQGSGGAYSIADVTKIKLEKTASGSAFDRNMIVGIIFDNDAIGVLNENRRTTSSYNANGEYFNNFYKCDTTYFNDLMENGVIFTIGGGTNAAPNLTIAGKTGSIFGVLTSKIQSNVSVSGNVITATLKKDTDDDGLTQVWGQGYFLALAFSGTNATTTTAVAVLPTQGTGFVNLDNDNDAVFKITNPGHQQFAVKINNQIYYYDLEFTLQ